MAVISWISDFALRLPCILIQGCQDYGGRCQRGTAMKIALLLPFAATLLSIATSAPARSPESNRQRVAASGPVAAYGEISSVSGFDYIRFLDGPSVTIGPLDIALTSGGFANNDFTREYAISYPAGDLVAIDTSTAAVTSIGDPDIGTTTAGPRWDGSTGQSYLTSTDCSSSTLYTIDLASAATTRVGSSTGTCIVALAIDSSGAMYGVDAALGTLVSINKATGSVQTIGSLGVETGFQVGFVAMDVSPADDSLWLITSDYLYAVDRTTGSAQAIAAGTPVAAFAFAILPAATDTIFTDGFDGS
jgi:hypothetical protein